jgi:hypothetical protein
MLQMQSITWDGVTSAGGTASPLDALPGQAPACREPEPAYA